MEQRHPDDLVVVEAERFERVERVEPRSETRPTGDRALAILLTVGGLIGLTAAFTLLVEKIALLQDPDYTPTCSVNAVVSCGTVMTTPQAELFGFPNPIIGVAAFPVLLATGVALLAGARLARWYWLGLQAGVVLGALLVAWLIHQSIFEIYALCPYCMVVWAVVLPTFWYVTLRNAGAGVLGASVAGAPALRTVRRWHLLAPIAATALVAFLIGNQFWF